MAKPRRGSLEEYCALTGRGLAMDPTYRRLVRRIYDLYLGPIGLKKLVPDTLVTDSKRYEALCVSNDWNGVIVDARYLGALEALVHALLIAENPTDVARPMVTIVARELERRGLTTDALMLRHEPLTGLYALEDAQSGLRLLMNCDEFHELVDDLKGKDRAQWTGVSLAYVALHELAHWIFSAHDHDNAIGRNAKEISELVGWIIRQPMKELLEGEGRTLESHAGFEGSNITQEIFCDRFASGVIFARAAKERGDWRTALATIRILDEARRLLHRALWIAEDYCGDKTFLAASPSVRGHLRSRGVSQLHLRSTLALGALKSHVPEIFRSYSVKTSRLNAEDVGKLEKSLMDQALVYFSYAAGSTAERPIFLLLRSVVAKSADAELVRFYSQMADSYRISEKDDLKRAFDRLVEQAAAEALTA